MLKLYEYNMSYHIVLIAPLFGLKNNFLSSVLFGGLSYAY